MTRGWWLLTMLVLLGASNVAAIERHERVRTYVEPSEAEQAAARERMRPRMHPWKETDQPQEYRFPWMQVGFAVVFLAVAAPFAWGAYKRSSQDLRDADAFGAARRRTRNNTAE